MWHGYFVVERLNIGAGNWSSLQELYLAMGTHNSEFPCFNTHIRTRLDGDAVIYESLFDPAEVSIPAFKELLADAFQVPVDDILSETGSADYAGYGTTVWTFYYDAIEVDKDRFVVERFGGGGTWQQSGDECRAYLMTNLAEWE